MIASSLVSEETSGTNVRLIGHEIDVACPNEFEAETPALCVFRGPCICLVVTSDTNEGCAQRDTLWSVKGLIPLSRTMYLVCAMSRTIEGQDLVKDCWAMVVMLWGWISQ